MLRKVLPLGLLLCLVVGVSAQSPGKRPLTHADYDIWNNITGFTLSPDGQFVAYTQSAPKGDASFVIRNLTTNTEWKFAKANTPPATPGTPPADEENAEEAEDQFRTGGFGGGGSIAGSPTFTPDSKFLYFVQTPTRAEIEKATAEKKAPEDMPRSHVAVLELATGKITQKITGIRSYTLTGNGAGLLVMVKSPRPAPKESPKETPKESPKTEPAPKPKEKADEDQQPPMAPGGTPPATPPTPSSTDLVIRNLADGKEANYPEIQDYSITKDFAQIVTTVASKKENNGVFVSDLFSPEKSQTIVKGAGRFYRLTWDDAQKQLAFFFDDTPPPAVPAAGATPSPMGGTTGPGAGRFGPGGGRGTRGPGGTPTTPDATATPPVSRVKPKVYVWKRPAKDQPFAPATQVIGSEIDGLKKGWQLVDRGTLGFSADGLKLNISTAPIPEPAPEPKKQATPAMPTTPGATPAPPATPDKVELDLWHWKDEVIQPMQKLRANLMRSRTYSAVYLLDSKKLVHLVDDDHTVRSPDFGDWAVGSSDKKYRYQTWESPTPTDYSLVNIRTGEAKSILTAARGGLSPSPKGNYLAGFDGKNWFTIRVPDGKKTILTAKLKPKFFNEEFDSPMITPPYGQLGWSADEKYFFVSDKHDIWKLAADGSDAVNITEIGEKQGLRFRLVRVEKTDETETTEPMAEPEPTGPPMGRGAGRETRERGLDTNSPWLLAAENLSTQDRGFYRMLPGQKPKLLIMGPRNYGTPTKAKKADTMVLISTTFTEPIDYYQTTTDFKEMKRITNANPHRANFNWATAEMIHYSNADGAKLSGILVKPENFDPTKKYPMIVYIYERFSNTFHNYREPRVTRGQVVNPIWYASNGYLVLIPDISYKIGYPGQSAINCVLPAIQAVADKGYVNEKAIGINGQSWGGYQIAYMVTQTNRFKAAVAGAAVSNMTSAYNGIRWGSGMARQFQYERTQSRIGETLWQAPMKYLENSPVFMADRVQTPLMMIHNDQDDAVPWYQGIEYYLSLRRLGKEVYMLNYNGELHNLTKTINARDFALRMHQFFEHHLKGAPMPEWMAKGVPFLERDKEKEQWKKLFGTEEKK